MEEEEDEGGGAEEKEEKENMHKEHWIPKSSHFNIGRTHSLQYFAHIY